MNKTHFSQRERSLSQLVRAVSAAVAAATDTTTLSELMTLLSEYIAGAAHYLVAYEADEMRGRLIDARIRPSCQGIFPSFFDFDAWRYGRGELVHESDPATSKILILTAAEIAADGPWHSRLKRYDLSAILLAPLVHEGQQRGHIEIWRRRQAMPFQPIEVSMARIAATPMAILMSHRYQRLPSAEIMADISGFLTSTLDYDEVLQRIVDLIRRYLHDVNHCNISMVDPDGRALRVILSWRQDPGHEVYSVGSVIPIEETAVSRQVLETKRPFVQSDLQNQPFHSHRMEKYIALGLRSILYLPLLYHGRPIGILHLNVWQQDRTFTAEEVTLCQHIANQAALAIENAQLHRQAQQQAQELAVLHDVVVATAKTVEVDLLLSQITTKIVEHLYPDSFGFLLLEEEGACLTPHASYYGIPDKFKQKRLPLDQSVAGKAVHTEAPVIVPDVRAEDVYFEGVASTRSEVAVPLWVDGRVVGVINVESAQLNAFSTHDVAFLTTLSGLVGVFLERVELYEALRKQAMNLTQQVAERTSELRLERDRMLEILESAGEGIILTDENGKIIFANAAMTAQTGYTRQALQQATIFSLGSAQTPAAFMEEMWQTVINGQRWSGEIDYGRHDGAQYNLSVSVAPLLDRETGQISGAVGVLADITRLKEVERLKTEFVSTVTHELRTPLTNITTYLALLERGKPEKKARYMDVLHGEVARLTQLIEDMLDIARLDTQQLWRNTETVSLTSLREAFEDFQQQAAAQELSLTWQFPEQMPPLHVKQTHLYKILKNLLINALSYTPVGGNVQVTAVPEAHFCRIDVSDTGPGIPPEEIPRLFERFFRGSRSLDENIPGTGLGLAIVSELASGYGGRVAVQSTVGEGACFSVWLPLA